MRKLKLLSLVLLAIPVYSVQAQDVEQRIRKAKYDYINEKVEIRSEQKEEFWKVYNEYNTSKKDLRIQMSQNRMGLRVSSVSDEDADKILRTELALKQEALDLEKEYVNKYREILSVKQVVALYKAEDDFNKMMMQRLRQRDGNNPQKRPGRN